MGPWAMALPVQSQIRQTKKGIVFILDAGVVI
jgi:hypothetical protein